ncbi:MAG: endonuclease/exonuclease/phosphatase family protein [Mariprofundaceae bacterium]
MPPAHSPPCLHLASFNIQAGIGSHRYRHLFTHGWRYVMPHRQSLSNLNRIADILEGYDIVGLQETDVGSFRTRFINQVHYLAENGGFSYWHSHITSDMGQLAQHGNSFLSRFQPAMVVETRLPASRHGRGVLEMHLHLSKRPLTVFVTHLSLRRYSRLRQIRFISRMINRQPSAVLMGDLNCEPNSPEYDYLMHNTRLQPVLCEENTFPSWQPKRRLDHILATDDVILDEIRTIPAVLSDHLPVTARLRFR